MRLTWRWDAFFLVLTCSGGQIRRLDRAKKHLLRQGRAPAGECQNLFLNFVKRYKNAIYC